MSIIIASDIDGCLTTSQKSFYDENGSLRVMKQFSDKDSYIIEKIREHLVFISGDEKVNRLWAKYRNIPFIHCPPYEDKWKYLWKYLDDIGIYNTKIAYLGDGVPDFECLLKADYSFVPVDASKLLMKKIKQDKSNGPQVMILNSKGGHGCLEEVVLWLIEKGELSC